MLKKECFILLWCAALFGSGCEMQVLRQDIPVSTDPMGAKIYADGKLLGQTPGTVSLERTKDHILTLVKENYRQEDVVITKQYQSKTVLRKAVMSGVNSGLFFKDKKMGLSSGLGSISSQEETGEAYILVPATVRVNLTSLNGSQGGAPVADGYTEDSAAGYSETASEDQGISARDVLEAGMEAGAAGIGQAEPIQKNWQTSSSSKSYVKPDGTEVTKKSSSYVGVSINPAGILKSLDTLFN